MPKKTEKKKITPPPETTEVLNISAIDGDKVRVQIIKGDQRLDTIITQESAGIYAATLLGTAQVAQSKSGEEYDSLSESDTHDVRFVTPNASGFTSCDRPGFQLIYFRLGEAHIGFALSDGNMKQLGEAILTLEANNEKSQ